MMVVTFDAEGLGDRSYLISDGATGLVVDAQRDLSPYLAEADKLGITIAAVFETHIHNDYVSGGLALARATGAAYVIPHDEPVSFADEVRTFGDGDSLRVGQLEVTAISTTGHTDHHLAFLVKVADAGSYGDQVVCTGGSLLLNATGRTDLLGLDIAEELARSQWRSVRRLLTTLAPETRVLPTHGFGSFCSATPTSGDTDSTPTIGQELAKNPAALLEEDEFVAATLSSLPPIPAYYWYVAPLNRKGPLAPTFEPVAMLDRPGLEQIVQGPRRLVDLRPRRAFAIGHIRGSLNLELGANLTTYLGWLVDFDSEIVLLAGNEAEIDKARRLIVRIGRDELFAGAVWSDSFPLAIAGRAEGTLASYPVASFADLAVTWAKSSAGEPRVLDVRHRHEWTAGHIVGARHLPVQELAASKPDPALEGEIWVHCAGGYRAAAAASILSGWGARPVLVDDSWEQALVCGLPIARE